MNRFFLAAAVAASLQYANAATTPAHAGGGDVAAGLVGGLAAGTIIGAAVAGPRYYAPHRRCILDQGRLAIGRADSRFGTAIGECGCTLAFRFANKRLLHKHSVRSSLKWDAKQHDEWVRGSSSSA